MDATKLMLARKYGCRRCLAFAYDADRGKSQCRAAPPRTSGDVKWPSVRPEDFCASFELASEEEEQ